MQSHRCHPPHPPQLEQEEQLEHELQLEHEPPPLPDDEVDMNVEGFKSATIVWSAWKEIMVVASNGTVAATPSSHRFMEGS